MGKILSALGFQLTRELSHSASGHPGHTPAFAHLAILIDGPITGIPLAEDAHASDYSLEFQSLPGT